MKKRKTYQIKKTNKEERINEFKEKLFDLVEEYHSYFCHNDEFFNGIREVEKQVNIEKQQHLNR